MFKYEIDIYRDRYYVRRYYEAEIFFLRFVCVVIGESINQFSNINEL